MCREEDGLQPLIGSGTTSAVLKGTVQQEAVTPDAERIKKCRAGAWQLILLRSLLEGLMRPLKRGSPSHVGGGES